MSYFDGTRSQISDAKNPEAAVSVLIKSILLRMDEALSGEGTEHNLRVLRDKLEAEKDGLVQAIAAKTGQSRGPNDPDDSEVNPQERDPLKAQPGHGERAQTRDK